MPLVERPAAVTYKGAPRTLVGSPLKIGDKFPDAALTNTDWQPETLGAYSEKARLVSVVPSLDTGICDAQTKRFNYEAEQLSDRANVITISADLPWRMQTWAKDAEVTRIVLLSDHLDLSFGDATGTHVKEMRIDTRAVFVIDARGVVRYAEYVPEIVQHPDYDAAVDALRELL